MNSVLRKCKNLKIKKKRFELNCCSNKYKKSSSKKTVWTKFCTEKTLLNFMVFFSEQNFKIFSRVVLVNGLKCFRQCLVFPSYNTLRLPIAKIISLSKLFEGKLTNDIFGSYIITFEAKTVI